MWKQHVSCTQGVTIYNKIVRCNTSAGACQEVATTLVAQDLLVRWRQYWSRWWVLFVFIESMKKGFVFVDGPCVL